MRYLDSKGLERAAWVTKNYAAQNWQMTKSKEWEVSFCPAPQTELEPIVDFVFTETPPVSGEKSPTNPSTINGVSSLECSYGGKNLLYYPLDALSKTINGVTFTYDNGVFTANGTSEYNPVMYRIAYSTNNTSVYSYLPAGTYTLSGCPANGTWNTTSLVMLNSDGLALLDNEGKTVIDYGSGRTFTIDEPVYFFVMMRLGYAVNTEVSNIVYRPQLEIGSTATSFEAANRTKCNVSLGNTYYGGSLNVKTGELTVTHECILARATNTSVGYSQTSLDGDFAKCIIRTGMATKYDNSQLTCTRFPTSTDSSIERVTVRGDDGFYSVACRINKSRLDFSNAVDSSNPTGEEIALAFDAWLQANPTYVVFQRTEPLIVQLTPQQILSLPQEDKYTPRINIIYTDQKSVRVGYRRLDCIELRSNQTVHGEKTFADSPLVPNPDDLDSQQAAPISFVKDMLRAEVEAMSGGRNTIIRDQWNNPHVMVRIPKFLLKDIDSSWPNEPHPAFIVNGVQKSEIFIGKYLASQSSSGKVQTLPRQVLWDGINFDNALAACRALGPGFCLNTNASWAARVLWLYKTLGGNHEYLGNRNYGRDCTYHELTGTLENNSYRPGDTSIGYAHTLTGTGGLQWNDDETEYGIADLVGNVWEWVGGLRINNGEIHIIPNNDASIFTCNMTTSSIEWKAILQDGTLVAPGTIDTLKIDSAYADASSNINVGEPSLNTSITNSVSTGYNNVNFKNFSVVSGVTVPEILKQLAIFPVGNDLQGKIWSKNVGERHASRGGIWHHGLGAGPFALNFYDHDAYVGHSIGFRVGFIS